MLGGAGAAVLGGAVDLAQAADTDGLAEVNVAGDRGGADVEPVNVLGGQLLGGAGLDGVDPTWFILVSGGAFTYGDYAPQGEEKGRRGKTYQGWAACPDASGKQHKQ